MEISLYPAYNVLSKMIYPRSGAARATSMCIGGTSQWPATIFRGIDQWGERYGYLLVDPIGGAIGAFSHADGISTGGQARTPICKLPNVEHTEQSFPVLFLYRKEITDSGGAGKWRGGLSAESCFIPHGTDSITHDTLSSGNAIPTSTGMMGGYPGAVNRYRFLRDCDIARAHGSSRLVERHRRARRARTRRCSCASRTSCRTRPTSTRCSGPRPAASAIRSSATPAKVEADVENGDVSEKAAQARSTAWCWATRARPSGGARSCARGASPAFACGSKKLSRPVRFLATENLAVHDNLHFGCAKCATDLGPISRNYKERCVRRSPGGAPPRRASGSTRARAPSSSPRSGRFRRPRAAAVAGRGGSAT